MNFNKKIKFKNFLINIKIKQNFFCINNRYYFGYPIGEKKVFANKDLNYQCRNLFGYFFIIEIKKDSIDFYTDVIGNYRVYYYYEKDFILITDDLNEIYKKKKKNFFKIDENTFNFFKLKNYTPGNTTFLNGIFKFQPASNYSIKNSNKFIIKNYYLNYKNTPNFRELKDKINRNFINQFKYLKNKKVVLFFSG